MEFFLVETLWPEKKGFVLHRDNIGGQYIFIHFHTPVTAVLRGEKTDIKPGGCVFFGANAMQCFSSPDCKLVHDWFHADIDCGVLMEKYGLECEKVYYPDNSDEITKFINEINLEYSVGAKYFKELAEAAAEKMMIYLARSDEAAAGESKRDILQKELFIQARAEIHMDICRQWTVEDMARLVNMSESRFYYLYKKMFGITPQRDLVEKRVQTAQMLLAKKQMTVKETARLTGYSNEYHFIRQFKQITGITPGKAAKTQ